MVRLTRYRFKLKSKNKLRVNLRYVAYYTLLWIACIEDIYNIYKVLKDKNQKYLVKIYWALKEKRFRDAKYIYKWHLIEV